MRANFKRIRNEGLADNLMKFIELPLNFLRDYSIPIAD